MSQLGLSGLGGIVLSPDALDEQRGAWCTPPSITGAVGAFDLDPFTNPRSTLAARATCMLERGDDGFGLDYRGIEGAFYRNPAECGHYGSASLDACERCGHRLAAADWRVWLQPPYDIVPQAIAHYGHTRFVALLRLDTSTGWYADLWSMCEAIMVPVGDRIEFVPPPGVKASSNPFPHGLFYKHATDVTDAVRAMCIAWPTPQYPWAADPLRLLEAR